MAASPSRWSNRWVVATILVVNAAVCVSTNTEAKVSSTVTDPAPWTGNMHPQIPLGSNPSCNTSTLQNCEPTYDQLDSAGALWKCPDGDPSANTCGGGPGQCVHTNMNTSGNPICPGQLNDEHSCCCPLDGCYVEPQFNQIIGICKGEGCGCGSAHGPGCAPQGSPEKCGSVNGKKCTGEDVPCCFGSNVSELVKFFDHGTQGIINYMAAYQFDSTTQRWTVSEDSSFNTDGRFPAHNLSAPHGGLDPTQAWLSPQPGGAMYWSLGYYAAGVKGVGPPAAMFVLSTEHFWGGTWYMLNQLTMDRGPASSIPASKCKTSNSNCWAAGNAGEFDMLETGWQLADIDNDPNFERSFSTQQNQIGRCFNGGVNGGGFQSPNYLKTAAWNVPEPIIYVVVVDSVGNWVYRIPANESETIWPGIGRKSINRTLQAAPAKTPSSVNPCVGDYCLVFTSNCQATSIKEARAQSCGFNGDQGWCGNWMAQMTNTSQPLVPSANCTKDVRGGKTMPWCASMVASHNPPGPPPPPPPGPAPEPTAKCPKCTAAQCQLFHCPYIAAYVCTKGSAAGGCNSNASFWPNSGSCDGCCDTAMC